MFSLGSALIPAPLSLSSADFAPDARTVLQRILDMPTNDEPWPTEIRLHKDRKALTITFERGESFVLPAEYLRVRSPSAEVQGHSPGERTTVPGKKYVQILEVQPVGNYAVRLTFDDMHSTGIFSWSYLLELGRTQDSSWQDYLEELAAKGLSREPPGRG